MKYLYVAFAFIFIASSTAFPSVIKYCTHAEKVDLNPYRTFEDVYDLTYFLLIPTPYFSSDPEITPVLDRWHFSKDGRVLTGHVSQKMKWKDGKSVSPREVAISIAKGLTYRLIGKKVRVEGTESINKPGWQGREYTGIKMLKNGTFQLVFESDIDELAGTIHDALGTNSRHNRIWVSRFSKGNAPIEVLSRYPLEVDSMGNYTIHFNNKKIQLMSKRDCANSDIFPLRLLPQERPHEFSQNISSSYQATFAIINTSKNSWKRLNDRVKLVKWLRGTVNDYIKQAKMTDFIFSPLHFWENEAGWAPEHKWLVMDTNLFPHKTLSVAGSVNLTRTSGIGQVLSTTADKQEGFRVEMKKMSFNDKSAMAYDIFIMGSYVGGGRQIWVQEIAGIPVLMAFLGGAKTTKQSLEKIKKHSSATIPVTARDLRHLQSAALKEKSIIPLTRRRIRIFSKKQVRIELVNTNFGEFKLKERNHEKD